MTHPFHPLRGVEFMLVTRKWNWGEDRVMYFDSRARLRSMLISWTNLAGDDLFSQISAGRSWFRTDDLLKLAALLEDLRPALQRRGRRVK
ncbi:DUF5372 family protein [Aromatoleum aromaticum]|uniref:DUF5372 family protein n=1 Tax=Aromatoleum aromaticum TaxID=551760 RepID=UPI00241044AE|nr:DUF5372 family protein [Aromatoleum aromaticum]